MPFIVVLILTERKKHELKFEFDLTFPFFLTFLYTIVHQIQGAKATRSRGLLNEVERRRRW